MDPLSYRPAGELSPELQALLDPKQALPADVYLEYDEPDTPGFRRVAAAVGLGLSLLGFKVLGQALFDAQAIKPMAGIFVVAPILLALSSATLWWAWRERRRGIEKRDGRHRRGLFFTPEVLVDVSEEGLVCVYPRARVIAGRILEKKSTSTNSFYKDLGLEVVGVDGVELRDLRRGYAGGANALVEMIEAWSAGALAWRGHSLDRRRVDG